MNTCLASEISLKVMGHSLKYPSACWLSMMRLTRLAMLSSLYSLRDHQYGLFAGERVAAGIGEVLLVDVLLAQFVAALDIEVACHPRTVMGEDEVADDFRESFALCHFQSFGDMSDDDCRRTFL